MVLQFRPRHHLATHAIRFDGPRGLLMVRHVEHRRLVPRPTLRSRNQE